MEHQLRFLNILHESEIQTLVEPDKKQRELSDEKYMAILQVLLQIRKGEGFVKGVLGNLTTEGFGVSSRTISRIWQRGVNSLHKRKIRINVSSRKKHCGRKKACVC